MQFISQWIENKGKVKLEIKITRMKQISPIEGRVGRSDLGVGERIHPMLQGTSWLERYASGRWWR